MKLEYKVLFKTEETIFYRYLVGGGFDAECIGSVEMNLATSECEIDPAQCDESCWHARQLVSKLQDFFQSGSFEESGTITGY